MTTKQKQKEKYLGEFEQVALLALIRLGDQAYGAKIRQLIHEQIGRDVAIGALYSTLERLEKKGMVTSTLGEPTAARGGRAKRFFVVTASGLQGLKRTREMMDNMWQGVSLFAAKN
jgi:DNA-binding PadR family transcriptional regulator